MTPEKAIEILQYLPYPEEYHFGNEQCEAIRLGIEALKCITKGREDFSIYGAPLLPGETDN